MRYTARLALVAALALATSACLYDDYGTDPDDTPLSTPGPFLIVGAGYAEPDVDYSSDFDVSGSLAAELRGGYRIDPHIGLELSVQGMPQFDAESTIAGDSEISVLQATINAKGYIAPGSQVEPYALLGFGVVDFDEEFDSGFENSEDGALLRGGLGIDIGLALGWFLNAEAVLNLPRADLRGENYYSLLFGVGYKFGGKQKEHRRSRRRN